ncbi:hypothetical protein, partial [Burkholderia gladioli]|uniref:hypothetical protein n=1 Tax=Burkholderia gladioli TaxID=28095 RepID=UPI003C7CC1FF
PENAKAAGSAIPQTAEAKATPGGSARMAALAAESATPHADQAKATLGGSARMAALAAATASAPSTHSQEAKPASAVAARP